MAMRTETFGPKQDVGVGRQLGLDAEAASPRSEAEGSGSLPDHDRPEPTKCMAGWAALIIACRDNRPSADGIGLETWPRWVHHRHVRLGRRMLR